MSLLSSNKKEKKVKEPKAKKVKEPKAKKVKEPKAKKVKKNKRGKEPTGETEEMIDFSEVGNEPAKPPKEKKVYPPDVYTLVLLIAWIALTAACVLAYLDLNSYK